VAGVIGATAVALWFLIVDTLQGRPLHTPEVLGGALFSLLGPPFGESDLLRIVGYTLFHYGVFVALGALVIFLVHRSRREPSILAGLLILFVIFEVGFYFFSAFLAEPELLGDLGWYQIGIANLFAAGSMGVYVWRRHPMLSADLSHALSGEE
jgi:hypothetical protein